MLCDGTAATDIFLACEKLLLMDFITLGEVAQELFVNEIMQEGQCSVLAFLHPFPILRP